MLHPCFKNLSISVAANNPLAKPGLCSLSACGLPVATARAVLLRFHSLRRSSPRRRLGFRVPAAAMQALREAEAELTVYVHPSNAADVRRAVARQLSTALFSYEDRFDGVLLAHEVVVNGDRAKILNGLVPYFGVPVHANLLLYSPQPDMILEGKVELLGKESIHAIVLGVFSAAIMSDDINEKFKFKRRGDGGKFISRSDKHHVIKKGSMIRFSVKRVDTEMNCHITGSLIPPHTGSMPWLSVHDAEYALEISSGVRRQSNTGIKIERNEQDHRTLDNEEGVMNSERPHKKSQKRALEE